MKSAGVPKSFVFFVILSGLFLVLLFLLFIPTFNKMPEHNTKHSQITSDIAEFEDVLANQKSVEAKIKELQNQYNTTQSELYIDANSSIEDLQAIFKELNITMTSLSRSAGIKDPLGRTSTSGFPIYTTNLAFTYEGTLDVTQQLIHYLEQESKGCYFINTLNITPVEGSDTVLSTRFDVTLYYFDSTQIVVESTTAAA
ncbi:MAG: hypothetical protein UH080_04705 [Ruminococcus sp.]|nr:hypothetical protein [Ruminococcus sp.]